MTATATAGFALSALALLPGCQEDAPPHAGRTVPGPAEGRIVREPEKPLPEPGRDEVPPPPFVDVPLVSQHLPEESAFVRSYNGVHRPRIAVFVNRTLEGELIPATDGQPHTERTDRVVARGPGYTSDHTDTYLRPGEYDEAWAKSIDYAAIETALTDWLSADHQVTIVSPATVRSRLSDAEVTRLQQGRPRQLGDLARDLDADILVQVQARPTRQTPRGTSGVGIRLIAEAVNVLHGESIARAQTTLPPPLDGPIINDYTRFLTRKLMSDMIATWSSPGPLPGAADDGAPPTAPPVGSAPPVPPVPDVAPAPPPVSPAPADPSTPRQAPATGGTDIAPPPSPGTPSAPATPRTLNPYDLPDAKPAPAASASGPRASDARLAPTPPAPNGELVAPAAPQPGIILPQAAPPPSPAATPKPQTQPTKIDLGGDLPPPPAADIPPAPAPAPEAPADKPAEKPNDPFTK